MKVIVCAVASLALLPAAQSAPEDKKIVFLSLEEAPSLWISDKPVSLYEEAVRILCRSVRCQAHALVKTANISRLRNGPYSIPLLDLPGPGYQRMRGDLPRTEDLR